MTQRSFSIQEIADALGSSREQARRHLRETGWIIDPEVKNPSGRVPRRAVVQLTFLHAGGEVGEALRKLLARTM